MALENCIVRVHGRRWKVREAISCRAALAEITTARCFGGVGSKSTADDPLTGGAVRVIADVVQVNSDNTERQPYTTGY